MFLDDCLLGGAATVEFDLEFDVVVKSNTLSSAALINNATRQAQIVFVAQTAFIHVSNAVYGDNVEDDGDFTLTFTGVTNNDPDSDDTTNSDFEHDITVTFDVQTEVK